MINEIYDLSDPPEWIRTDLVIIDLGLNRKQTALQARGDSLADFDMPLSLIQRSHCAPVLLFSCSPFFSFHSTRLIPPLIPPLVLPLIPPRNPCSNPSAGFSSNPCSKSVL